MAKNNPIIPILLICAATFAPERAHAKPISYVGGVMVMQENDETGNSITLDYTLSPNYAVALYAKQENGGNEFSTIGPQLNTLIKRWNLEGAQANIFNMSGAGVSRFKGENDLSAWTNILADYETRRVFTSYELRLMYTGHVENTAWQRARVGVAPYVANYDDLHTWIMFQIDHHPAKRENVVGTPLVRFFYHTTLLEAGYSSNHYLMFNFVQQF